MYAIRSYYGELPGQGPDQQGCNHVTAGPQPAVRSIGVDGFREYCSQCRVIALDRIQHLRDIRRIETEERRVGPDVTATVKGRQVTQIVRLDRAHDDFVDFQAGCRLVQFHAQRFSALAETHARIHRNQVWLLIHCFGSPLSSLAWRDPGNWASSFSR